MKMGILSQWFDPETGPAAIPGIFAREFVRAGHQTSVLTGFPNYPDGRVYDGYRQRIRSRSSCHGVDITRVPLIPSHSGSKMGRLSNYASFSMSATALGHSALRDADAIWVYNSPITISLPLLTHSRWGKKPYFLHVQDIWPDSLLESGMFPGGRVGQAAATAISTIVRLIERHSATIGVISPSVRELILERNPELDPAKIIYAPNPTDESIFFPRKRHGLVGAGAGARDEFTVMYIGAIGDVQGLDTVLGAAALLQSHPRIRIVFVGSGIARERLTRQAKDKGLKNVTFVGRVPKTEVPEWIASADVQLVSLGGSGFLTRTTPSKIPSLLASRVPIIAQIAGDGAQLIRDAGAGVVTTPGSAEELAEAIAALSSAPESALTSYADHGHRYYVQHLSATISAKKILTALGDDSSEEGKA